VLDLYAGSGALGFEALSRGACRVTFVDRAREAVDAIRANAESLGVVAQVSIHRATVAVCLSRLSPDVPFGLVFLDPPYADREVARVLAQLAGSGWIDPAGLVVVESDRRHAPGTIEGLAALDERRYGDTLITRYVPAGGAAPEGVGVEAHEA